jgi:type I restriction enzyme S subunit
MRETLVKAEEFKDSPLGKIPTGWQVGRLSNFYAVPARNGLYKSAQYYGRGVLMIHMPQMFRGLEIDVSDAARVDVSLTELERFELKPGDLVFARRSLNLEGAGRCSLVPELPEPVTFESSIIRVRLSREQLRPAFANYFLNSEIGFRLRLPLIRQVAVSGVSSEDIASIPILVPPIPEQERIIEIIGTVDEAIAHTSSLIAKLKLMKAGLLHDLLTRGLDENGELRDACCYAVPGGSAHPEQFKDSPLGRIPKEWEIRTMEEITTKIVDGVHKTPVYVESGIPFLTVENLTAGIGISLKNVRYVTPSAHAEFFKRADPRPGDILVSKDGTLGIARIVTDNLPEFSIFVSVAQLRPNEALVLPSFICTFFETGEYERQLGHRSAGTGLKHIHLEHFRAFQLAVPPIAEQHRISKVLNSHDTRIRTEEAYRDKLKLQKQGLMHDLLTGKVRVKDADKFTAIE